MELCKSDQDNLSRGIVNWSGVAQYVVEGPKQVPLTTVSGTISLYFNLKQKPFSKAMLAVKGFHSENIFCKKCYIKNLPF